MPQDQGVRLGGLVEDMARMYPASVDEADLNLAIQQDVWHVEWDGAQVQTDLERAAWQATRQVMALEKQWQATWDAQLFDQKDLPAVEKEERLYAQHAAFTIPL